MIEMSIMHGEGSLNDEYAFQHAVVDPEPAQLAEDANCMNDCVDNVCKLVCFVFTPIWPYLGVVLSLACGGLGTTCVTTGEVSLLHPLLHNQMHRSVFFGIALKLAFHCQVCGPLGFPAGGVFGLFVCLFLGILSIAEVVGRWGQDEETRHHPLAQSLEQDRKSVV